jgi:hypothetical protein
MYPLYGFEVYFVAVLFSWTISDMIPLKHEERLNRLLFDVRELLLEKR